MLFDINLQPAIPLRLYASSLRVKTQLLAGHSVSETSRSTGSFQSEHIVF